MAGNDTRGWVLVHDQIRAVLVQAADHVQALRAEDVRGAQALDAWWQSFSRSFAHHMHTEDARIWPSLRAADTRIVDDLEALTAEHRAIETRLRQVDSAVAAMPAALGSEGFADEQGALGDGLVALRTLVGAHLRHEEATAFVAGHEHVQPAEWSRIERDMVKGLRLKDVSTLLPRILEQASPADRAMMLRRLPPPVRLIGQRVFEPRYRRMQRLLPGATPAPRG